MTSDPRIKKKKDKKMAQNQVDKRRNLATNAITHATQLWDSLVALKEISDEAATAGNFLQTDFDDTDLAHLTPASIGAWITIHAPAIYNFIYNDATRKQIILEIRR
jgi:hypothetical protein